MWPHTSDGRRLDGEDHDHFSMHNSEHSLEVRELKDELSEKELKNVLRRESILQRFQFHASCGQGFARPHDGLTHTGLMETTMRKTNDTEKTRELTEAELNTVSGGNLANSVSSALDGIFKAASTAAQKVG